MKRLDAKQAARLVDTLTPYEVMRSFVNMGERDLPEWEARRERLLREFPTNEEWAFERSMRTKRASPGTGRKKRGRSTILKQRTPPWADLNAIEAIYAECRLRNAGGIKWHVDHVIPLQGTIISGLHVAENLAIIPARENIKKHNRFYDHTV